MNISHRTSEGEQAMMQRIMETLFALAALMERACNAPAPVRWFLVKLLLPVEPVMRWFVVRTAWKAGAIALFLPDPVEPDADNLEKAFQLAECFRAFAMALQNLPKQLYDRWRNCAALDQVCRYLAEKISNLGSQSGSLVPQVQPAFQDTS